MVQVDAFFHGGKRFVCVHTKFYNRSLMYWYFVGMIKDSMLDALEILCHGTGEL
jgi:hypothetical protein